MLGSSIARMPLGGVQGGVLLVVTTDVGRGILPGRDRKISPKHDALGDGRHERVTPPWQVTGPTV